MDTVSSYIVSIETAQDGKRMLDLPLFFLK